MVSYLCQIAKVSRSGYYNYFASKSQEHRFQRDKKDELIRDNILKAYNFKGRKFHDIVICNNYYILIISFADIYRIYNKISYLHKHIYPPARLLLPLSYY